MNSKRHRQGNAGGGKYLVGISFQEGKTSMAVKKTSSTTKAAAETKAAVKPAAETKETAKPAAKAEKAPAKAIETKKDTTQKLETKAAVLVDTPEETKAAETKDY